MHDEPKSKKNPAQFLAEKEAEYTKLFANPYNAAKYAISMMLSNRATRVPHYPRPATTANQEIDQPGQETW